MPKVKVVDRSYSESAPAGAIVAQDPPEGKRIRDGAALLVSVSKGSAYAELPSVTGLEGADAYRLLERNGFTATRRYAPSTAIEAWHAVGTDPGAGTTLERPVRVTLLVSTGPPKRLVPALRGMDADGAATTLRDAGFAPVVVARPDAHAAPGTVLDVTPSPGTRAPLGAKVTIVATRAPHWDAVTRLEGTEDASPQPLRVPAGARLVLATTDTSPLGLWGGTVAVEPLGGQRRNDGDRGGRIDRARGPVRRRPDDRGRRRRPRLGALDVGGRGTELAGPGATRPRSRARRPRAAP